MQRIAIELKLDHLEVIKRNLVPKEKFPYRAAAGALYDSGDYLRAVETATGDGPARRSQAPARRGARRRPPLRHRLCRRGRARHVEHGLSLDLADAGGARQGRPQERRGLDGDGQRRSARRGLGDRRRHRARAGPCDRALADRRRSARACARRRQRRAGDGHRQGSMVDRRRHLFLPLHARHRGRGASCRASAWPTSSRASRQSSSTCCREDIELVGGKIRSRSNPDNALPFGRVAGTSHWSPVMLPEGMAPALARDRGLVAAGARAARERRPHQHVADLRLRLRHVRDRDRSLDLSGAGRPLYLDARRRPHPQSADRRGPDARRLRAGDRRRALRGVRLRRQRPVPDRHLCGLSRADGGRNPARSRCCIRRRRRRLRRSAPRASPKATA